MKSIFTAVLLFLLFIPFSIKAQVKGEAGILIKYEASFATDSTNTDSRITEVHQLYTGSSVSLYGDATAIILDSLMRDMMSNIYSGNTGSVTSVSKASVEKMEVSGGGGNFQSLVYKDLTNSKSWVSNRILTDNYLYEEESLPLQWNIGNESKTIGDYTAQKANISFGGRNWEAWFTMEIPISDGPYIFSGLPGLILELKDDKDDYKFELISLENLEKPLAIELTSGMHKSVSKKDYIKAYKNNRENPFGEYSNMLRSMDFEVPDPQTGGTISSTELLRRAKKELDKRNNYIEKW